MCLALRSQRAGTAFAMIRMRDETPFPSYSPPAGIPPLLPIPLPTSSPPLLLPSTVRRANIREACLPPRKRLRFAFGPTFKVGESSYAPIARPTSFRSDYGFVANLDDEIMRDPERDVGYGITNTIQTRSIRGWMMHKVVITELQAADRRRQAAITELLVADRRIQAQFIEALKLLKGLQTHMTEFQR
ncbi:hypothetical protein Tco_1008818 [Tanacetum coccineum]